MELTQKRIYEDIEEIRETIESSKRRLAGPYKLFFAYGILQGLVLVLNLFATVFWRASGIESYFNFGVEMVFAIAVTFLFVKVYKEEKDSSNRYYLSTIGIWGIIAVVMPFLLFAARLVIMFLGKDMAMEVLQTLADYKVVINILLVCAAMITVAYVTDMRWQVILAILVLFGFILANLFPQALLTIPIGRNIQLVMKASIVFYYVTNVLGYLGLGFLLLYQERKSGNIKHTRGV